MLCIQQGQEQTMTGAISYNCILVMKGQNQPAVFYPATLSELTLKPPFVSFVFRSLMLREAVTFN